MTKNTDTISTQKAASAAGKAALSGADILQPAQYDALSKAGLPTLRSAFPQYRELAEVLQEIAASPEMTGTFRSLTPSRRQEFLDFCCGNRGVRVLYDSYFKYVFDPDVQAAALSRMISVLIGLDVKLVQILPNESHLGADYTLVIMDIIVEASDGSIVNVEVQKIGYNFPGERAACYNADLLLRQYQRIRKEFSENDSPQEDDGNREKDRKGKKGTFSYKYIRPVYTIVFMETSTKEFHRFRQDYVHTFAPVSDTGLKLNLLQNYIFVPLDIFRKHLDALLRPADKQPMTEKEAWLAFLSSDDPQVILRILEDYPGIFRPLYDRICTMCQNTKEMMHMFSEELSILDKNTVMMMIEEQQETIEQQKQELSQQKQELSKKDETIGQQKQELSKKDETIGQQKQELSQQKQEIEHLRRELEKALQKK